MYPRRNIIPEIDFTPPGICSWFSDSIRAGAAGAGGAASYKIPQAIRFNDDDSAYMHRTPSVAGNRKTWTWSGWVKRGNLGTYQRMFMVQHAVGDTHIIFRNTDAIHFYDVAGINLWTNAVYRDPSAWYHIVIEVDTTQATASDRAKIYVSGERVTSFNTETYPALNTDTSFNDTTPHYIGTEDGTAQYLDGYLADVHFIDGAALTAASFGETDIYGNWVPIAYSGTYGTNGFHIDGADSADLGLDASGTISSSRDGYNDYTGVNDVNNGDSVLGWGMKFVATHDGQIGSVDVHADTPGFSGVTVRIETDSSTAPSGTLVDANGTIGSLSSGAAEWVTATFPNGGPVITAGTTYWIVVVDGTWSLSRYTTGAGNLGDYNISGTTYSATNAFGHNVYVTRANSYTTSGLTTADQMLDSPTDDADNGVGNYCTWSPLHLHANMSLADGNLDFDIDTGGTHGTTVGTTGVSSGKWYFEVTVTTVGTSNFLGVAADTFTLFTKYVGETADSWGFWLNLGQKINNAVNASYGTAPSNGDVVMCAFDMDNGKIWWGQDGVWEASGDPAAGTNAAYTNLTGTVRPAIGGQDAAFDTTANFGQSAFAHTPPTGFKALCTGNLPAPAIPDGSAYFQTTLYTGNGTAIGSGGLEVNQSGNSTFQPDLAWIKNRDAADNHMLFDVARGVTKYFNPNTSTASTTDTESLSTFDSDGFTVGSNVQVNTNAEDYVAWQWLLGGTATSNTDGAVTTTVSVNTATGISSGTYVGTGAATTFGHGLDSTPEMFWIIRHTAGESPPVYHKDYTAINRHTYLSSTVAETTYSLFWNDVAPTSTVFTLGTHAGVNSSGVTGSFFALHSVEGFSKIGSYEGNGNTDGTFVYLGFRPAFVMCKSIDSTSSWYMYDSQRAGYNVDNNALLADTTGVELTADNIDLLSNGFKLRIATDPNVAETYIYAAFAEHPFGGDGVSQARAR